MFFVARRKAVMSSVIYVCEVGELCWFILFVCLFRTKLCVSFVCLFRRKAIISTVIDVH